MNIRRLIAAFLLLVVSLVIFLPAPAAQAGPSAAPVLSSGAVVALRGTSHLFIVDANAVLHWAGDTRALQNRFVDWGTRSEVSLDELKSLNRGDPWLSAGLLKNGDPIYLVKWETSAAQPTLLHIQSISDVELFGINATNYGSFVIDRPVWEQRFGFAVSGLQTGELASAVVTATPTPAATATASLSNLAITLKDVTCEKLLSPPSYVCKTTLMVSGAPPRTRVLVSLAGREYICFNYDCPDTRPARWGPTDQFGDVQGDGTLKIEDTHGPYAGYTYTIKDATGKTVTITLEDDFKKIS